VRTEKTHSSKVAARGPVGCAVALFAVRVAGWGLIACNNGSRVSEALPSDGGANDGTLVAFEAAVDASDVGVVGPDATVVPSDALAAEAEASCAVDAGPLDDAEVALGEQLVAAHKCHSCHGQTLSGNFDGVPSPTTEGGLAYPPNLTPDPATGLGCWTNAQIENAFLNGIDNQGMPLCPPMPRFGQLMDGGLDPMGAQAVVEYLRSLPIISQIVPNTPNCPQPAADAQPEGSADAQPEAAADATTE